jgi:hypothetical protein
MIQNVTGRPVVRTDLTTGKRKAEKFRHLFHAAMKAAFDERANLPAISLRTPLAMAYNIVEQRVAWAGGMNKAEVVEKAVKASASKVFKTRGQLHLFDIGTKMVGACCVVVGRRSADSPFFLLPV